MSKERAQRRAEREREAAIRAAARAAEAERQERRAARARTLKRHTTDLLPRLRPVGRDTGALARRRRVQRGLLVALLLALNMLVWVRPSRLGGPARRAGGQPAGVPGAPAAARPPLTRARPQGRSGCTSQTLGSQ